MSCIPGLRVARRARSRSTDYDLVCAMDGVEGDFRSDFGRYFVCECRDWSNPVNFTSFAKFSRVLDSVNTRFGVIFSKEGLSGSATTTDAVREQLKVYQDRGLEGCSLFTWPGALATPSRSVGPSSSPYRS